MWKSPLLACHLWMAFPDTDLGLKVFGTHVGFLKANCGFLGCTNAAYVFSDVDLNCIPILVDRTWSST